MKGIRNVTPYVPGEQPNFTDMIKLNTNENPYPPSPKVAKTLKNFSTNQLKRYNSVDNLSLKESLAQSYHLTPNHFVVGNGSDEILAFCFLAFFNCSDPVLFPTITYGFYRIWADLFKIPYKEIPLNKNYEINFEDYNQLNGGIIIANPNAPTGIFKSIEELAQLLEQNSESVVIIDEAYIDFAGTSAITLLERYPNLVIVQTFSKSRSLAGLRVGYAIGNPELMNVLAAIKSSFNPYSVDMIAESLAKSAVEDSLYYEEYSRKICQTRKWFDEKIKAVGFKSLPSSTNFLMVTHPKLSMEKVYQQLEGNNIFVRYFSKPTELQQFLRISIGTQEEMAEVYQILENILKRSI
ncbi:histidinol-phosphate transaminase [Enterococcus rivorum]|uniref:Histidinol-phosphate aminotransferase n=1 Tax=Enterococcus rivorum TaxID=762845 RepID=A0A1E5KWQ4_9ENTE|nr:histidinol-phosphate transaminase [Enterococcus rivorum]MBP2100020.1 histidinol-phosphate aminotransferase [Enterococcus rivorum]OEH82218.1 histidinol-phosphate transaminase [Enterococcus rivorum]